jgi:hypothetical protein
MRESLEIIAEIRGFISSQNPMRFPHQETILVDLLNELENTLNPVEESVVEESIVEVSIDVVEQPIVESLIIETTIEEPISEEPTVEVVAPKKTTTRKK